MLYIAHRINTIEELNSIPLEWGVEIDLRDFNDDIVLQHDPYISNTIKFEDWLNDKKIRDEFMSKIIGHGELYDNEVTGTVSSFGDKNVIDRYSQIEIPQKTKDLIRQDSELHYLIGKLNYNYKKI